MNDKYTIDEISRFLNLPKSTLRYYDSIGLCRPASRDEKTGYRYYEYNQLFLLNMIGKLKKLRLSLDQIRAHSQIKNTAFLEKLLLERRSIIRKELGELRELDRQNEELIRKIAQARAVNSRTAIEIREIPARYQYRLSVTFPGEELYSFIKILYTSYIKNLKHSRSYEKGEILLEISRENLVHKQFGIYNAIGFFVSGRPDRRDPALTRIPAGTYAVACHIGRYDTIEKTYRKLMRFIEKHHYEVTGNSVETSLINIAMTNRPEEFVTEIQVPVGR